MFDKLMKPRRVVTNTGTHHHHHHHHQQQQQQQQQVVTPGQTDVRAVRHSQVITTGYIQYTDAHNDSVSMTIIVTCTNRNGANYARTDSACLLIVSNECEKLRDDSTKLFLKLQFCVAE